MSLDNEKSSLLSERRRGGEEGNNQSDSPSSKFVFPLTLVLLACSVEMSNSTINQYIYKTLDTNSSSTTGTQKQDDCNSNGSTPENSLQKESADRILFLELLQFSIAVPVTVITGTYCDIYGRNLFMILSVVGNFLQYIMCTLIVYLNLHLNLFYIAYAVSGMFGTYYCFILACSASIADISRAGKHRSFYLALVFFYLGVGLGISEISAGYLIKSIGFVLPFILSSVMCLLNFVLLTFFLKETLDIQDNTKFWKRSFRADFKTYFGFYDKDIYLDGSGVWKVIICLVCYVLVQMPVACRTDVEILYLLRSPFCLSSEYIGWFMAAKEVTAMCIGTLVLKVFHCCINDELIVIICSVSGTLYFVLLAFSTEVWMLFAAAAGGVLCLLPMSLIKSILSKIFPPNKQGIVFSNIILFEVLGKLCGSTIFLNIYGSTQLLMRGFVFLVFAAFNVLCILLSIPVLISNRIQEQERSLIIEVND